MMYSLDLNFEYQARFGSWEWPTYSSLADGRRLQCPVSLVYRLHHQIIKWCEENIPIRRAKTYLEYQRISLAYTLIGQVEISFYNQQDLSNFRDFVMDFEFTKNDPFFNEGDLVCVVNTEGRPDLMPDGLSVLSLDLIEWLTNNAPGTLWTARSQMSFRNSLFLVFKFKTEEEALHFKMRWHNA